MLQQTSEPNFPDIVRIAISKQGVTVIHPKTKVSSIDNSFKQAFLSHFYCLSRVSLRNICITPQMSFPVSVNVKLQCLLKI